MKRMITGLLAAVCFVLPAAGYSAQARGAALYDCLTGSFLWEQNGTAPMGMASTTKIMTALVALELYDTEQVVTVQPEWCGIEGSSMYLRPGEKLTVRQLLQGLMLMSGNDAAAALAGLHPEGQAGFVAAMNQKAQALGLRSTRFENPSGLDGEGHSTTAQDLALLAAAALEHPEFAQIVATQSVTTAGRYMKNHNRLLFELEGCIGVKTGYTKSCGRCLVSALERNGRRFIAVTLGDPDDWRDHRALLEQACAGLEHCTLLSEGLCAAATVVGGSRRQVGLAVREGFDLWLTPEEQQRITVRQMGPRFLYAPVETGQIWGTLQVLLDDKVIFEEELYCVNAVDGLPELSLRQKIKIWWESR